MLKTTLSISSTISAACILAACGSTAGAPENDPSLATASQSLWETATTWPGRSIPVCFSGASANRSDFATRSRIVQEAIWRSWGQATGLTFTGWQTCPANTNGLVVISLDDTTTSGASRIGYDPGNSTTLFMGVNQPNFEGAAMHEFGHALGFVDETGRPGFNDTGGSCSAVDFPTGNTLGTLALPTSIMVSKGICNNVAGLSYWDITGAEQAYGFPNYFADVTGDGRVDAILAKSTGTVVRTSNGSSFNPPTNWTTNAWVGSKGTAFVDVTGDFRADLVTVDDQGIHVRRSLGDSFGDKEYWTLDSMQHPVSRYGRHGTYFGDMDGDNKADFVGLYDGGIDVMLSDGTKFQTSRHWGDASYGDNGNFVADVSGDGLSDFVSVQTSGIMVNVSLGSSLAAPVSWAGPNWFGQRVTAVADIDGDGKADLIGVDSNGVFVRRSDGTKFVTSSQTFISTSWYGARGTFFCDVDGDGRADILGVDEGGVIVRRSNGSSFPSSTSSNWTGTSYYGDRI